MRSPVVFQPLERELEPVLRYLKGDVLNSGCGDRDITKFLVGHGASTVEHCDIHSAIPGALICDLTSIPRPADRYDAILCNAVLEHVRHPGRVLGELRRLLKPGGHLILVVPFLQPYHAAPADFQRYTADGLIELGTEHRLEVVEVRPVHSMAQTIAWVTWACLEEQGHRWLRAALWMPLWLWTRTSQRTDERLRRNANTLQIVLRKTAS